ncbi:MAG: PQQ-binding-like beta-propeller repeat protein [Hyphomonadaceae bacterium]
MHTNIKFGGAALAALMIAGCTSAPPSSDTQAADAAAPAAVQVADTQAEAPSGPHPGEAVYKARCAACHDNPTATKAPSLEALARYSPGQITNALITGRMVPQAVGLSSKEVGDVSNYLAHASESDDSWIEAMMCPTSRRTPKLDAEPTVAAFGFNQQNTRRLSYEQTGMKADDFANLELAWAVAFPQAITMRSQAAVVGSSVFIPVGESKNRMFAFDISDTSKPCIQWVYEGDRTLRSSTGYGVRADGVKMLLVGDLAGYVHAVDAMTGKQLWEAKAGLFDGSVITATPVLVGDKVIAASSQYEIMLAAQPNYECCKIHGGVVALNAMTGEKIWEGHTMPDAKPVRDRGDGKMLWSPAGAPVWNSPSIDLKRNQVYVGTGEANSVVAHPNTDALIAFDMADGSINWSFQATANDIFNVGCGPKGGGPNCATETVFRDVDFGASTILAKAPDGSDMVLAGQKSGTVWAMNPDTGKVIWRTHIGTGGPNGGIHWGIAADDTHVYAPISYPGRSIPDQVVPEDLKPGLYAVNLKDGTIDWKFEAASDCTDARKKFVPRCNILFGFSGAPTIIGDYVVSGGLDGRVYVLERKTGKLVKTLETAREFETVNGVPGNGASVDNASIVATNGLLLVNSGYGLFGQGSGNVMLAYRAKSK